MNSMRISACGRWIALQHGTHRGYTYENEVHTFIVNHRVVERVSKRSTR
jgi:hypothetical protein